MQRLRVLIATTPFAPALLLALAAPALLLPAARAAAAAPADGPQAPAASPAAPPAEMPAALPAGQKVPAMKTAVLMPGAKETTPLDLGGSLGRKPILICYVTLGEGQGEEAFLNAQKLATGPLKGRIDYYGASRPGRKITLPMAVERLSLLGVEVPFIVDDDFTLGATLGVTSAPAFTLIDAAGVLRVVDARSLKQTIAPGLTLAGAVERAAKGAPVPTAARLPRYYPVNELVGEQFPDFILKRLDTSERVKMSDLVARDRQAKKIPVLFFWHPNCPHCKKAMPSIVVAANSYGKYVDLVSVTDLKNNDEMRNAQDTIKAHNMTFPVLLDEDHRISDLYHIVSTPTFVFLKPDGVVDSAYTSASINPVTVFQAKIKSILGNPAPR